MILSELTVEPDAFAARTGWVLKPEGACKGDVCVPLPDAARRAGGSLDVHVLAERLGMPLLSEPAHGVWALGPDTAGGGRVLTTAKAPDLELPDAGGNLFALSNLLGKKVLLVAWASW